MNYIEQIEKEVSKRIDEQIKDFDNSKVDHLKSIIRDAKERYQNMYEPFLVDALERAERLECFNVCIAIRDLLKEIQK